MEDREDKRRFGRMLHICVALGAIIGLVLGGELVAGLGMSALMGGWLAGALAGGAIAYRAAMANQRGVAPDKMLPELAQEPSATSEAVSEQSPVVGTHVQRLLTERENRSDISRSPRQH